MNEKLAKAIYDVVGGAENILAVYNCMTRLRLNLAQKDEDMLKQLKEIDGVIGIHDSAEELQIVLGPGKAASVAAIVEKMTSGKSLASKKIIGDGKQLHEQIRAQNATPGKLIIKRIASIFMPLIPGFIACGLLTGLLAIAAKIDPSVTQMFFWQLLATAGNAVFWGMNLFVGVNAAKEFGGSPIIGGILGAFISHPSLATISFDGANLVPGRGGVIAVILVAFFAATVEKFLHRNVPDMFDLFVTPFVTVCISVCAATFLFQPLGQAVSQFIGSTATTVVQTGGAFTGFVLGGIWLPLVMMGLHHGFTPIHADLLANYGVTILLPILAMAGAGQVGASLAVYFKTKSKFLKKTIVSALPIGMMGVGEPLIYGVTLPLGKPFAAACIGGAFGGAVEAYFAVGARAMGISGLPLAPTTDNVLGYLAGIVTAYICGFAAAWIIGFEDPQEMDNE